MTETLKKLVEVIPVLVLFPLWAQVLFVGTGTAIVASILVFALKYPDSTKDSVLPELTRLAKKHARPYLLESVTMIWRLEFDETASHKPKLADVRTVYTIFALEDMADTTSKFTEQYHTSASDGRVAYLRGSENEKATEPASGNKHWAVLFSLKKGERRTIVTAARIIYQVRAPGRGGSANETTESHGFGILGSRQDAFYYPNDEDVIGELTILVQADSIRFEQAVHGDAGLWDSTWTSRKGATPSVGFSVSEGVRNSVVVARWTKLEPRSNAGVLVRW